MNKNDKANKNYELLFLDEENQGSIVYKKIEKLLDYYNYDQQLIKQVLKEKIGYKEEFILYTMLKNDINSITDVDLNKFEDIILENFKKYDIVQELYKKGDKYYIKTDKGDVVFETIMGLLKNRDNAYKLMETSESTKELQYYLKKVKRKETRRARCHGLSINGSRLFSEFLGLDNTVVTGYAYQYIDKVRYLHSWIEFEQDGEPYVIDSTLNVIMNKSGYYLLMNIKEREIESKVSCHQIIDDFDKYGDFINYTDDAKTYLTCRDLIIKDLSKNDQAFKKIKYLPKNMTIIKKNNLPKNNQDIKEEER